MSNHVKGKVTDIYKVNEKEDPQYGKSAQIKVTIDNGAEYSLFYNYGKGNIKPEPCDIGDEIEFQWVRNEKFGTKDILHKKDNYTLKNLTNPGAIPEKKAFNGGGGGYKADPDRDVRIVCQSSLQHAIAVLTHNNKGNESNGGGQISKKSITELADYFVDWVMSHKADKYKQPQINHSEESYYEPAAAPNEAPW